MDSEKQKDEITALESIYTSEEFTYQEVNGQYQCTLKIFLNLPAEYDIIYKDTRNKQSADEKITVSHLPPLTLFAKLPLDYPSKSSSEFKLSCSWLCRKDISKLCKKLDELWRENEGLEILFTWVAFLQNETLQYLGIENNLNIAHAYTFYIIASERAQKAARTGNTAGGINTDKTSKPMKNKILQSKRYRQFKSRKQFDQRAIIDRPINRNPVHYLLDHNDKRLTIEFKRNFYTCKICFIDKSGESCTQFKPCLHIFCKECISGYLEVRIEDGAVQNIHCPEEKCASEANPGQVNQCEDYYLQYNVHALLVYISSAASFYQCEGKIMLFIVFLQVKELVSAELFAKYDSTLLSATLDTMLDIVYCPRRNCQYPVSKEPNEKMASCPCCQYTFCVYCKMVYHGVESCKYTSGINLTFNTKGEWRKTDLISLLFRKRKHQRKVLPNFVD